MPTRKEQKSNSKRLVDLKAALKKAKPRDTIDLAGVAALWGVSKQRMVHKLKDVVDVPPYTVEGNRHLYPAKKFIQALINHIEGHEKASKARQARQRELIGGTASEIESEEEFSVQELVRMNQLAADIEQREINQGKRCLMSDVEHSAAIIFTPISQLLSNLSKHIDPHGKIDAKIRAKIDEAAKKALLQCHADIKRELQADVEPETSRRAPGRTSQTRTRRKGS